MKIFLQVDELLKEVYLHNESLEHIYMDRNGLNISSKVFNFNPKPTTLTPTLQVITELNAGYQISKVTIENLDRYFAKRMSEIGFELVYNGCKSPSFAGKVNYQHMMMFNLPLSKRITRPSMRTLLGLNNE